MTKEEFIQDVINLFSDKTGCATQYNNCPCNTCFHSLDKNIDFQHITWLLLLALRGDYEDSQDHLLDSIRKELFIEYG